MPVYHGVSNIIYCGTGLDIVIFAIESVVYT